MIWCKICDNLYYLPNAKLPAMRHYLPLLFLFLLSTPVSAQSINFHSTPIAIIDYSPRWRIGIEYDTQTRLAYSFDIGFGNYALNKFRVNGLKWGADYEFLELRPEVKYYFSETRSEKNLYAGVELLFLQLNNAFTNITLGDIMYEEAIFHKQKFGGHFKVGATTYDGPIYVDLSIGVGTAHRNRYYTDKTNPQPTTFYYDHREDWGDGHLNVGKSLIWHFTYNLKIGFVLWRKEN